MDDGTALLVFINQQLQQTIIDLKRKLELEAEARSIKQLFHMGCGFTDFLSQMFFHLDLEEVQQCRLVCSTWKDFVDEFVWLKHPLVKSFEGFVEHEQVYCGGEIGIITSDQNRIFCAKKTGSVLVFDSMSFPAGDSVGLRCWHDLAAVVGKKHPCCLNRCRGMCHNMEEKGSDHCTT